MALVMGALDFEAIVRRALDSIPDELAAMIDNCVLVVQDAPPPGVPLLGLYEGVPLTERGATYAGLLPDVITIFRLPILAVCDSPYDVEMQVKITVVHEIAHHFGIDEHRLDELGYG